MKIPTKIGLSLLVLLTLGGCKDLITVEPQSELAPSNVLTTQNGLQAVLYSAYGNFQNQEPTRIRINISEVTTDMAYNTGGGENLYLSQFINFTWDPSVANFLGDVWAPYYYCIRDANIVLDNVANVTASDAIKRQFTAEARFLRAYSYSILYSWYGPVPLRTSSTTVKDQARATDDEMKAFIEKELTECVADLPDPGKEQAFGRATKGAAYAALAKFLLNTKQWQKAADVSQSVIGLNYYSLYPSFTGLFRVENEGNKEMIIVSPCLNVAGYGNWFMAGALPPAFKTTPQIPGFVWTTAMANFATQYRLRSAFVNTIAANDQRGQLVVKTYVNTSGATVDLMTTPDNARSFKYWDNSTLGNNSATDVPLLRYADILLTRAEALNEVSGPTAAAVALVNQVRTRAGLANLPAADIASASSFRDAILRERGWEFISEGKRREDLIRHGKFISLAQARGVTVANANKHVLFPIPQSEIDANQLAVQNPGY
ncbi:RagB/SusD family nutrient uptake outer membrane protein [Hymenobacter sp. GOD-10R]|uniref:RagB/SusD family nutrient uptake outer membrane protein n=1 Tax=Hymenobacter sp. GOD-10R TaxID=3093922 RepID=UPI002D769011|nr:RagB/SusD family nutrient uptake outer membrane protein [Hymenobacter sp. GOD-10R]WRQ27983.1 RagB/SusD family nutrient uptake outer membrane protein [Hymenobacter sp. GOD-10R]